MKFAQKYLFTVSAIVLAVFSSLGFYLVRGTPPIKTLVVSGHTHMLEFAFGAVLFGLVLSQTKVSDKVQKWLAVWMSLTFIGPGALIYAGMTGNTSFLSTTDALFQGSFVVLWLILGFFVAKS